MLSALSRRPLSATIQNVVVIVRHLVLFAERAAQVSVEDVIAGSGIDRAARVGANNDVDIF